MWLGRRGPQRNGTEWVCKAGARPDYEDFVSQAEECRFYTKDWELFNSPFCYLSLTLKLLKNEGHTIFLVYILIT